MIDEMVVKNCKRRLTLSGIEWIDYCKVYDMVRHSWILKQIETLAVTGNDRGLITESMQNWNKKLTTGGQSLGNVKIRQGIFQRNSLSWRACVLACYACLRACVLTYLPCLRVYVLGLLACLVCLRACVLTCLVCLCACVCACYDEMFYFLTCLRTWCAFLSYLLYISIFKFKNSYSIKSVCFVKLNIFFIYILISTYKTI